MKKALWAFLILMMMVSCASTPNWSKLDIHPRFRCAINGKANEQLFRAVKQNDYFNARDALAKGANPNVADGFNQTVLMWACWNEMSSIVDLLLEQKYPKRIFCRIDINQQSEGRYKYNALLCAARTGNMDIFNKLIREGADTSRTDANGETILHKAAKSGNSDLAEYILKNYPKFNINRGNEFGYTPLHLAVIEEDDDMVMLLLEHKADPKITTIEKSASPLSSAYKNRSYTSFVYLLQGLDYIWVEEHLNTNSDLDILNTRIKSRLPAWEDMRDELWEDERIRSDPDYLYMYSIITKITRKDGEENMNKVSHLFEINFRQDIEKFYAAVKDKDSSLDDIRKLGQRVFSGINKYGPNKKEGELCILHAIENGRLDVVKYLIEDKDMRFKTTRTNSALCYASQRALGKDGEKYFEILDQLLDYLIMYDYIKAIRPNGIINDTGDNALMLIVKNTEYLRYKKYNWNYLKSVFERFDNQGWLSHSNNSRPSETVIERIVDIDTGGNRELRVLKNEMFKYLCNSFIKGSPDYPIGGQRPLLYLLEKKYYYGANLLLLTLSNDGVRNYGSDDLSKIISSVEIANNYLSEIEGRRFDQLRAEIRRVIERQENPQTDAETGRRNRR